jgi:5'-nucleotidase
MSRIANSLLAVLLLGSLFVSTTGQQKAVCNVKVTLLQVNDVYQFMPVDQGTRGGLGRLLTLRKSISQTNPNTLFLLAGDTLSPSVESITYKGAQMVEAWNMVGLDYATFGNHEFDFGPEVLRERMKESKFGWIAANVIDKTTGKPFGDAKEYVIREFQGVKIGIFGLVLPETRNTSRPGPDVDFLSPCETAKRVVPELHDQGAKVVVALTHLSMREDKEVARCANVDLVIGGHEHTLLESAAGGAPILKMTSDGRELGQVTLNISQATGELDSIDWKVVPVNKNTKEDPEFTAIYKKYGKLLSELAEYVGTTNVPLDARTEENRTRETNAGNLVTDSFRRIAQAEVAIMNGGSVRADNMIGPGRLTVRDVLSILPFKNRLIKLAITGATLRAALEHGVGRSAEDAQPGRFPQVSGIQFSFDASRPAGQRVVDVKVNGRPLSESRKYSLATTTFLSDGGDGYAVLKNQEVVLQPGQIPFDFEALRRFIATARTVSPKVEGRITRLDKTERSSPCPPVR